MSEIYMNGLTLEEAKQVHDFYFEKLKFCGCGRPEDTLLFIKNLLVIIDEKWKQEKTMDNHHERYTMFQNKLREVFEFENKQEDNTHFSDTQEGIIQFVLYYLNEVDILEHGGSVGGSWLSEEGKNVLQILNKITEWGELDLSFLDN